MAGTQCGTAASGEGLYAIDVQGNGSALVRGNEFKQAGSHQVRMYVLETGHACLVPPDLGEHSYLGHPVSHQVRLGADVRRAVVADNLCEGEVGIRLDGNRTRAAIHDNVH